jgi:tRNA(Ile)-lysidine synthase TilS/MesJ
MKIMKNDRKWFLTKVKKACMEYDLIKDKDYIAVGLSGGKDSSVLLYILNAIKREIPIKFEIYPIFLNLGFNIDITPLKNYCESLDLKLIIKETQIAKIIFDIRKEKNPCALCANMRRGALNDAALETGCKKVALGHHLDDIIETYFLNLIYTGKMGTFKPSSFLDRKGVTVIRPMIFLEEKTTAAIAQKKGLPVLENPCPIDKKTKREDMKLLIDDISSKYPDFRYKFLTGLKNFTPENLW